MTRLPFPSTCIFLERKTGTMEMSSTITSHVENFVNERKTYYTSIPSPKRKNITFKQNFTSINIIVELEKLYKFVNYISVNVCPPC